MLEVYNTPLFEVREVVEPVLVSKQHASLLNVEPFSLALHLASTLLTHQSEPFQYSEAILPRQRAHYQVRFQGSHPGDETTPRVGRTLDILPPD